MQLSKLTFSLASLVLISALVFATIPVMAEDGGPTVTIGTVSGKRTGITVEVTYSPAVTVTEVTGADLQFTGQDGAGKIVVTATSAASVVTVPANKTGTHNKFKFTLPDITNESARKVVVWVPADGVAGVNPNRGTATPLNQESADKTHTLPPVLADTFVKFTGAKAVGDAEPGAYNLTITLVDKNGMKLGAAPSSALSESDLQVMPAKGVTFSNFDSGSGEDAQIVYTVRASLTYGVTAVTITVDSGFAKPYKMMGSQKIPIVTQELPTATLTVSGHNSAERTYRLAVMFARGAASDGSDGLPVTVGKWDAEEDAEEDFLPMMHLSIKDAGDVAPLTVVSEGAERAINNEYTAILKYDSLAELPLTVTFAMEDGKSVFKLKAPQDAMPPSDMVGESEDENAAPVFTEGATATRSIAENTAAGMAIGDPVAATDEGDTLTYSLSGTDMESFDIVAASGQLQTKAALEADGATAKTSYMVTVTASDGGTPALTASIDVTITVTNDPADDNTPPMFATETATRSVAENTTAGMAIGDPVTATDADTGDTLTYSLGGTDMESFAIVSTSGQLQTSAALDYETKTSYMVTVTATDAAGLTDSIDVTINVTDVDETPANTAPVLEIKTQAPADAVSTGTFSIAYTITDPDTDDTVTVSRTYTVSPSSAKEHYTVADPANGMVVITQAPPTATTMTIPGATVIVTLTANDSIADPVSAPAFTVSFASRTYTAPNIDPVFATGLPPKIDAEEGVAITPVTFGATDSDGGTLVYSWDVDQTALGLMLNTATGEVSGTPKKPHSGSHPITVVDNQGGSVMHPLMVTVVANTAPEFEVESFDFPTLTEGMEHPVTLPGATDGNSDTLTYSIRGTLPTGLTMSTDASKPLMIGGTATAVGTVSVTYVVSDGRGGEDKLPLTITVNPAGTPAPTPGNKYPTFNGQTIAPITGTVGTAIIRDLPEATDSDGDSISYSIRPTPSGPTLPASLDFNRATRRLSGTLTPAQASTDYIYVASDGKGGTAQLTLTITVRARTVAPPSGDLPATYSNKVTTISSGTIAGNSFAVVGSGSLPDLEAFLFVGGTIGLGDGDGAADKNLRTVVISEILWGLDLGAAVDMETQHQFIELYNTTNETIDVSNWTLTFTEGRSVPASDIDQVSNRDGQGWVADIGQSGRVSGTSAVDVDNTVTPLRIVSMYRNINYNKVETEAAKATVNRGELLKGVPGGNAKGSWKASTRHTDNRWIYDSRGRKHATSTAIITASSVARSPFVINEVGNGADNSEDWIELRNVTGDTKSLKNYHLSMVTATGTDISLVNFHDKDYKVPGNGFIVIANTDPSDTDLAGGVDVSKAAPDQDKKGAQHLYYVDANLKLPNNGNFNLILRNAHDKLKASSHFIDVVGMQRYNDNSRGTSLWPLSGTGAPHGNVNENGAENFASGIVYIRKDAGGGTGEKDWGQQGYTGVGYDRTASASAANGGTPGYDNGAVKEKVADVSDGDISISEIMIDTGSSRFNLPQWIEIYNSSMTRAVNLNAWKLQIENAADPKVSTFNATLTLDAMTVAPNQTVLIVSTSGRTSDSDHFPSTRVVNLWTTKKHREALEMVNRNDMVLSPMGFHLTLIDKDNKTVDMVGNLDGNRRTRDTATWDIPMNDADDRRSSLIRRDADGEIAESWVLASETGFSWSIAETYYGAPDDVGSPGFRGGGPLPVSLSKFRPERLDDGSIVIRWVTESELDNAGFNILRSETKDGEYTKLNEQLIAGNGTTSERNTYDFADTSAKPNVVYYYQIQDVSLDGDVQTLRVSRLKGHVSAAGKLTTTWGDLKLQD